MKRAAVVLVGACLFACFPEVFGFVLAAVLIVGITLAGLRVAFGAFPPAVEDVVPTDGRLAAVKECARPNCRMQFAGRRAYCSDDCRRLAKYERETDKERDAQAESYDPANADIPF